MWCTAESHARGLEYLQIGLFDLTRQRKERQVPCGPGGRLSDYVPFHFCPRSIMLYQIDTGRSDYKGGQEPIIHFVSTVETLQQQALRFVFTDRHAKTSYARFFDDVRQLEALDWRTIRSNEFARTEDDPDRPQRKEAELLVYQFVPLTAILGIGVHSKKWKEDCDHVLRAANMSLRVEVKTKWYY